MPTYVIKRDGLVVGACTADESVGPLAWFNRNTSQSMAYALEHDGYSYAPLMTRKDMWVLHDATTKDDAGKAAREALHHEHMSQYLNDAVRRLVVQRIGKARIEASTDEWFNDIPLREWDMMSDHIKLLVNSDVRRDIEPCATPGHYLWSLSTGVSVAKCVAREVRDAAKR